MDDAKLWRDEGLPALTATVILTPQELALAEQAFRLGVRIGAREAYTSIIAAVKQRLEAREKA